MVSAIVATSIKKYMDANGISITFVSMKTGISLKLLSRSFLGKRKLLADEMLSICKALNVTPDFILELKTTA